MVVMGPVTTLRVSVSARAFGQDKLALNGNVQMIATVMDNVHLTELASAYQSGMEKTARSTSVMTNASMACVIPKQGAAIASLVSSQKIAQKRHAQGPVLHVQIQSATAVLLAKSPSAITK